MELLMVLPFHPLSPYDTEFKFLYFSAVTTDVSDKPPQMPEHHRSLVDLGAGRDAVVLGHRGGPTSLHPVGRTKISG